MKINYTARKVNLKDNFKERVEKKLSKYDRVFSDDAEVMVTVTVYKNRQTVEITINDNGMIYRVENTQAEMNDALDQNIYSLGRQIRKNKTKLSKRIRSGAVELIEDDSEPADSVEEISYEVCRKKSVSLKPMSVDEAILRMNMVNHKFFMFLNADTDKVSVVYIRDNGDYGMLESEVDD
ncbi:MAG: ribosome-associated translation inhibitor RaiA [Lachnospiraceae bacterium]|nr:ribosome-associated translation inhibitor RaiA [Lachnospiraceae bacterium]